LQSREEIGVEARRRALGHKEEFIWNCLKLKHQVRGANLLVFEIVVIIYLHDDTSILASHMCVVVVG